MFLQNKRQDRLKKIGHVALNLNLYQLSRATVQNRGAAPALDDKGT
jgi:hypothetical protein